MTTEDPKAEIEVPRSGTPAPKADARRWTLRRISGLVAALAAVGTVLAGLTGYWTTYRTVTRELLAPEKPGPIAPAKAAQLSFVVLPFTNLSGDPSQDNFADAITENLTTSISRCNDILQGNCFVIARNTAFTYKGKNVDAKEIGKELGVRFVIEGSVQRNKDRVRVNAQLIDANSGAHLWADQFDTSRADLLQMQDEIVARITSSLGDEAAWRSDRAVDQKSPASINPMPWILAMRCRWAVTKAGYVGNDAEAGYGFCERALDADPNNVLALAVLATKFYVPVLLGLSTDPHADLKRADELASRLLALDANSWLPRVVKGQVLRAGRRFDDAIAQFERALVLDPNSVYTLSGLGFAYSDVGQYEKAIEFFDKAIPLSPRDPDLLYWYTGKSIAYFALQRDDQAIEWARRAIAIKPNYDGPLGIFVAAALALTGHEAEARDAEQRNAAVSRFKSIAALKASFFAPLPSADPRVRATFDRLIEGARKAGMPEE